MDVTMERGRRLGTFLVHLFTQFFQFQTKTCKNTNAQALQIGRFQDCSMKMTWNGFFDLAMRH